ncbi:hypothetical protein BC834DRAFT_973549 [Gloeopeniophorella convolvens]|nr:hypothetical protein BC834DRAFT_973549 [Gloeopeniophorella convolvens]
MSKWSSQSHAATSLPNLPSELWLCIFDLATDVSGLYDVEMPDPYDEPLAAHTLLFGPAEENRAIRKACAVKRSLVLVCKRWRVLATPLLYQTLHIGRLHSLSSLSSTLRSSKHEHRTDGLGSHARRVDLAFRSPGEEGVEGFVTNDLEQDLCDIISCIPNLQIFVIGVSRQRTPNWPMTIPGRVLPCLGKTCGRSLRSIAWRDNYGFSPTDEDLRALLLQAPNLRTLAGADIPLDSGAAHAVTYAEFYFPSRTHPATQAPACPHLHHALLSSSERLPEGAPLASATALLAAAPGLRTVCLYELTTDSLVSALHAAGVRRIVLRYRGWTMFRQELQVHSGVTHLGVAIEQAQAPARMYARFFAWLAEHVEKLPRLQVVRLLNPHGARDLSKHVGRLRAGLVWMEARKIRFEDPHGELMRPRWTT